MEITVRYFAQARELAGVKEEKFQLPALLHVQGAVSKIVDTHPRLRELRHTTQFAINGRMTDQDVELKDGDVIAVVPPIAGG